MMYSSEWPGWLKFLVISSIVIVALGSIWGQVRDSKLLRAIARELLAREGEGEKSVDTLAAEAKAAPQTETVKDQLIRAAEDSSTAVVESDKIKRDLVDLKAKLDEMAHFKIEFARYIVHAGRNDPISQTKLFKEYEQYLNKLDEERRKVVGDGNA